MGLDFLAPPAYNIGMKNNELTPRQLAEAKRNEMTLALTYALLSEMTEQENRIMLKCYILEDFGRYSDQTLEEMYVEKFGEFPKTA